MLDVHLAELYGVENRALKQAVRRNMDLFPKDFMFVLIALIFEYLKQFEQAKQEELEHKNRRRIGFKTKD